jgi:nucleotide-binding universal stress UspA family protein
LDLAEELDADLIVLGSRGLGPVGRLALGSVAEGVTYHAPCPVLVSRGGESSWPPGRVVFAYDGSQTSWEAAEAAASLCADNGENGVEGLIVQAYPRLPEVDKEGRESDARMVEDDMRLQEKALMERAGDLEAILGSRPKPRLAVGDAAARILEVAAEEIPERTLVALGSRGLGTVGRMTLGSVSAKTLRAAQGPVLVHPTTGRRP